MRLFPILVPPDVMTDLSIGALASDNRTTLVACAVPWPLMERYEMQVFRNHRMGLEGLAQRGGLDAREAMAAVEGVNDAGMRWPEANGRLVNLIREWRQSERDQAAA